MKSIVFASIVFAAFVPITAAAAADACHVLTTNEVRSVQGAAFEEAHLSTSTSGAFDVSQCFYRLPSFADSVSLSILRPPAGNATEITRAWWNETFRTRVAGKDEREREARRERESEEEGPRAIPIRGLGDDAAWSGNRILGDLYVLRGDAILRISVGGKGNDAQKLKAARRLAAKALARM